MDDVAATRRVFLTGRDEVPGPEANGDIARAGDPAVQPCSRVKPSVRCSARARAQECGNARSEGVESGPG